MLSVTMSRSLDYDSIWLISKSVRVGSIPVGSGTPDRVVTVTDNGDPVLRVDVYSYGSDDSYAFEDATLWRGLVLIGFGNRVHAVAVEDRSVTTINLDSYFGSFHVHPDFVLIASGQSLYRLQPDRTLRWISRDLGIDGVLVHEITATAIHGEGEWDPPGGWQPFAVAIEDGKVIVH